jgi:hypothetical protein
MQMKKNQSLQGVTTPSSVGCGSLTLVVTGMIKPGGHVNQTGSGPVVVGVLLVVLGGRPVGRANTVVQSAVKTPVEAARNVITWVGGHEKPKVKMVGTGQSAVKTVCGIAKLISLMGGHEIVLGLMVAGNDKVMTVGPFAETVVKKGT